MGSENKRTTGDLELVFAEPKGFCFGVRRAIASLEESLERHGRVYALGSPIHNPQEVERLLSKGLVIIETPSEMPMGGTVFVRAHGVSDLVMKELHSLNALVVDGTCPFVSKAKEKAALLSREGYTVMILGDEDHPEVKAIRLSSEGPVT
ncbi:MAG TPA: 4-hydroxy-3-methylbut-2-enyl diphosphate reductase, partial [Synergistales bacterium]|nr:4-hydroxy-3-methylbut-2-enyl diphosphate reductase [Synergistales bacterium]